MPRKNRRPNDSWNINDLRRWIEQRTEAANRAIDSYMERRRQGQINPTADRNIIKLQKATGQKKVGLNQRVASLSRKRKADLLRQAEALRKFEISEQRSQNWTQKTKRKSKKKSSIDWENMSPDERSRRRREIERDLRRRGIYEEYPEPTEPAFMDDEKKRRAYETFNRDFGGEEGIDPWRYQWFLDTIGGIDFENYNVESDAVAQNIIDNVEKGYNPKRIIDAWDFAMHTEGVGDNTQNKVIRADLYLRGELEQIGDNMWIDENGEVYIYN